MKREIAAQVWNFLARKRNSKKPFEFSFEELVKVIESSKKK